MSLSEMSKATYMVHRRSIRANGRYALRWIKCPLEKEDFIFLMSQDDDLLQIRSNWMDKNFDGDKNALIIKSTTESFRNTFTIA